MGLTWKESSGHVLRLGALFGHMAAYGDGYGEAGDGVTDCFGDPCPEEDGNMMASVLEIAAGKVVFQYQPEGSRILG